jgi:hypothetical protein
VFMFETLRKQAVESLHAAMRDPECEDPSALREIADRLNGEYFDLCALEADLLEAFQVCSAY